MKTPYRIGLTGGIGSGKSTIAAMFKRLGVPVIDADAIAKRLVEPGGEAYYQVVALTGEESVSPDGRLRRDYLRKAVFADASLRSSLEAVLHPLVYAEMENAIAKITYPYCILNIPLLIETSAASRVDRVLVVDVPEELQIRRTSERDGVPQEQVQRIMDAQADRSARLEAANDVIDNSGDLNAVEKQVQELHRKYQALAEERKG
jgi:dephospho-CoA kinase